MEKHMRASMRQSQIKTSIVCLLLLLALALQPLPSAAQGGSQTAGLVGVAPIPDIIQKPANLFDLQGKTLRFTPNADGSYSVATLPTAALVDCPTVLDTRS